jgi:hypothetical protein
MKPVTWIIKFIAKNQTTTNYKIQFSINEVLKDEIWKKKYRSKKNERKKKIIHRMKQTDGMKLKHFTGI